MRYFAKPSSLDRLSLEARVLYTGFCLFLLFGYGTSAWLYLDDGMDTSPSSAARYYQGSETETGSGPPPSANPGPKIDLPAGATDLRFAKPPRQIVETFHFHLFSVPVVLLIVAHLFMMCRLSTRTKVAIIALATAATFVHIILPPLIRFTSPAWARALFPSAALMTVFWGYMTAVPIYEMWRFTSRTRGGVGEIDSASG